ncbi:endosomal P24A protein [Meredithblackwellia eburnea MCA 4105]
MILRPHLVVASLLVASTSISAFYLPGAAPKDYLPGDKVPLLVNSVTPGSSELKSIISYDYYDPLFNFCKPKDTPKKQAESLGSVLFGDRLYDSPFEINMLENVSCRHLCTSTLNAAATDFLSARIRDSYSLNWLVDGLPAAEMKKDEKTGEVFYSSGFSLGSAAPIQPQGKHEPHEVKDWRIEVNNHFQIYLEHHSRDGVHQRVVGVLVWPTSDRRNSLKDRSNGEPVCGVEDPFIVRLGDSNHVPYTYSITWIESPTPWATRWDSYLRVYDPKIHVLSLINSIIVAVFLCLMVAMILLRTVHRDISRYNAIEVDEDVQEDFGWKLVHGEVFRAPKQRMFLAVLVGNGLQLAIMSAVTLFFALLGFLSPSNRGSLSTVMIVCWTLFGVVAGYVAIRLYTSLRGENWKRNIFYTATLLPTALFFALFLLNFFLIGAGSSGAVPFGTFMAIVALWFLINIPLTILGAYFGGKKGPIYHPVRINQIPRQIPPSEWWLKPWPSALLAGLLPFGAAFIECYFIMQSLFGAKVYYAFGFLALTFAVVALTTATSTILLSYFLLSAEEYRWHWRSFLAGGGSAFWLLAYGILYWATRLHLDGFANKVLYLGYLLILTALSFLITGSIGFVSTYAFLRVIYSRIRVD